MVEYLPTFEAMQEFTMERDAGTADEIWMLQHPPVYTLGLAAKTEHILEKNGIPVVNIDRGGQVTYHGPGQLILYLLLDLKRSRIGVRELVTKMEDSVIELLRRRGVAAESRREAPGVYVEGAKIAALGLRIRRGCSYHGLSLNVDMDLSPFGAINPCGYRGLPVTKTTELGIEASVDELGYELIRILEEKL